MNTPSPARPGARRPTLQLSDCDELSALVWTEQAADLGWDVAHQGSDGDLLIATAMPDDLERLAHHPASVAVVRGNEREWARSGALDAAGLVVATVPVVAARIGTEWAEGLTTRLNADRNGVVPLASVVSSVAHARSAARIGVATSVRSRSGAHQWGDTHMARSLMRGLRRRGHPVHELIKPDWQHPIGERCDAIITLRGLARRPVRHGQINILWIISHPERVTRDECDDHDIVASASAAHARELSQALGRKVLWIPQAADADTFRTGRVDPHHSWNVVYVGNARWPPRRAPRWMISRNVPFTLIGDGWATRPEARSVATEFIDNRSLPSIYRSSKVVVADHHGSMRSGGFAANRLFDVLSSGGTVVSDDVIGLSDLFGATVPTYSDPQSLAEQIRRIISDDGLRRELAVEGRELVAAQHTLQHRADLFSRLIRGDLSQFG